MLAGSGGTVSISKTEQNAWRMFRIMGEFVAGFQQLSELPKAVTIFGSARAKPTDPYYKAAEEMHAPRSRSRLPGHQRRRSGHHGGGRPAPPRPRPERRSVHPPAA